MLRIIATVVLIGCLTQHVTPRKARGAPISGISIIDGVCLSKRTDRLVYRHKNETHVYIAFDILKKGTVDVFTWSIFKFESGNFISYKVKIDTVLAVDFRKQVIRKHIIGATGRRHEDRFRHRVKRKMDHCKKLSTRKGKHCKISAIQSLFVRLTMRKVSFDNKDGCPS